MNVKLSLMAVPILAAGLFGSANAQEVAFGRQFKGTFSEEREEAKKARARRGAEAQEGKTAYAMRLSGSYITTDMGDAILGTVGLLADTTNTGQKGQFSYGLFGGYQRNHPDVGGRSNLYRVGGDIQLLPTGKRFNLSAAFDTDSNDLRYVGGEASLNLGDPDQKGLFDKLTLVGTAGRARISGPGGSLHDTRVGGQIICRVSPTLTVIADGVKKDDLNGDEDYAVRAKMPLPVFRSLGVNLMLTAAKDKTYGVTLSRDFE